MRRSPVGNAGDLTRENARGPIPTTERELELMCAWVTYSRRRDRVAQVAGCNPALGRFDSVRRLSGSAEKLIGNTDTVGW